MVGVVTAGLAGALSIAPGAAVADTVTDTIPIATGPFVAAMSADGTRLYFGSQTGGDSGDVSVVDVASHQMAAKIDTGTNRLVDIELSPDGSRLYSGHINGQLTVIDTGSNTVARQIAAGSSVYGIGVTPDGGRIYTSDFLAGQVRVHDATTLANLGSITVGSNPRLIAITQDGSRAYVANSGAASTTGQGSVSVIDLATNRVVATIMTGLGTWAVTLSPDGTRVYASNSGSNTVSVIDVTTNAVTATVPVGPAPYQIAFTPDGTRAYVLNRGDNTVSVLSTATEAVVSSVPVSDLPGGIAIAPDGLTAYVGLQNATAGAVSVIALDTFPQVTTTTVSDAVEGRSYTAMIETTGRPAPTVAVSAGSLPPGLVLDADGTLRGTPAAPGTYAFTVTASSSVSGIPSSASRNFTIAIAPRAVLVAGDDDFTAVAVPASGGAAGDVLANDTVNGAPVETAAVILTLTDAAAIRGASLDGDGVLTLPTGAEAGTHRLSYRFCERADPDNCATGDVLVRVLAAQSSSPSPVPTGSAGGSTGNGLTAALASTGAPSMLPAVACAVVLLGCSAALLIIRRRARTARP